MLTKKDPKPITSTLLRERDPEQMLRLMHHLPVEDRDAAWKKSVAELEVSVFARTETFQRMLIDNPVKLMTWHCLTPKESRQDNTEWWRVNAVIENAIHRTNGELADNVIFMEK